MQLQHKMLTISDIQLQSTSIEYHTCLYQQVFVKFFPFLSPPLITMSSAASRAATTAQGMYRVARDGTINAAVLTVGWTQSHFRACTHGSSRSLGVRSHAPSGDKQIRRTTYSTLTVLCSFAPALSISRLRANLSPNPAGLPHSPHHTFQR